MTGVHVEISNICFELLCLSKRYETFSESVLEFSQRLFSLHKFEENNSFQGMKNSWWLLLFSSPRDAISLLQSRFKRLRQRELSPRCCGKINLEQRSDFLILWSVNCRRESCHLKTHWHLPRAERCVCACDLTAVTWAWEPSSRWVRKWARKWVWKWVRDRARGMFQMTQKPNIPKGVLGSRQAFRDIQLCVPFVHTAATAAPLSACSTWYPRNYVCGHDGHDRRKYLFACIIRVVWRVCSSCHLQW